MNIREIKAGLTEGKFDGVLAELYGNSLLQYQKERYAAALEGYREYFQASENTEISIYSAPGRTEIAGNHTDHQQGRVLAAAVNLDSIAVASAKGNLIRIKSAGYEEIKITSDDTLIREEEKGSSQSLVRGICSKFMENSRKTGGFDAYISSLVLEGSGLSSSASFETLIGTILNHEYNNGEIPPLEIAQICQYGENAYFGKPCGLMDQLACAQGGIVYIDFKDIQNPISKKITLDLDKEGYNLWVVDTGGSHAGLTRHYAAIPTEMEEAAAALGTSHLGYAAEHRLVEKIPEIRQKYGDRTALRALHFFMENENVSQIAHALNRGDFQEFLRRIKLSGHYSFCYLQNIYRNDCIKDQGLSLALALSEKILNGEGAFRVHGGGFAGTILAVVPHNLSHEYKSAMNDVFGSNSCLELALRDKGACTVY